MDREHGKPETIPLLQFIDRRGAQPAAR